MQYLEWIYLKESEDSWLEQTVEEDIDPKLLQTNLETTVSEEEEFVPKPLIAIALKALQPDPEQRYQNVKDFSNDLKNYQAGLAVSAYGEYIEFPVYQLDPFAYKIRYVFLQWRIKELEKELKKEN